MNRRTRLDAISVAAIAGILLAAPSLARAQSTSTTTTSGTVPQPVTTGGAQTQMTPLMRIQRAVAKINAQASTPEGEAEVVKQLCSRLSVTPDSLEACRDRWGLDYGETAMVLTFAKSSKKKVTPDEIVEMRRSGTEWDVIAKDLGLNIQAVAKRMGKNVPPTHK
jgi:parvulin-like peptidyl-prolyl isomerase